MSKDGQRSPSVGTSGPAVPARRPSPAEDHGSVGDGDQLLKSPEAADLLAIGKRKLWELTNSKRIPCIRIDRSVRYRRSDLIEWVEQHRQDSVAG